MVREFDSVLPGVGDRDQGLADRKGLINEREEGRSIWPQWLHWQRCIHMRTSVAVALMSCFSGCASSLGVTALKDGKYHIHVHMRRGLSTWPVTPEVAARATAYCAKKGMSVEVLESKATRTVDWTPQGVDITFKCVSPQADPNG
jgi:putative hemolysin